MTVTPAAGVTLGPAVAGADATLAWDPSTGSCTLSGKAVVLTTERSSTCPGDATANVVDELLPNLAYIVHSRKMEVHYITHAGTGGAVAKLVVRLDPSVLSAEMDFAAGEARLETVNTGTIGVPSAASAVFEHFGADHVVRGVASAFDPKQLLALCSSKQTVALPANTPQHNALALDLRPYQLRAIRWMVDRENRTLAQRTVVSDAANPMWQAATAADGKTKYFHQAYSASFTTQTPTLTDVPGGILADEMGLGKTVEIIGLILENKFPSATERAVSETVVAATGVNKGGPSRPPGSSAESLTQGSPLPAPNDEGGLAGRLKRAASPELVEPTITAGVGHTGPLCVAATAEPAGKRPRIELSGISDNSDVVAAAEKERVVYCYCAKGEFGTMVACDSYTCKREWFHLECIGRKITATGKWVCRDCQNVPCVTYPEGEEDEVEDPLIANLQCFCGGAEPGPGLECCKCRTVQHAKCTDYTGLDADFTCATCATAGGTTAIKATLIISPGIIKDQWRSEIDKHTNDGALKVLEYCGVREGAFVRPERLAEYDVVVTTYEVLKHEVHHVTNTSQAGRGSRHSKRYAVVPTPLTQVVWWRICLDEAQLVDGGSVTKAADMASRLVGVNRWCVSGTPFSRGIRDLYGLLYFLRAGPFDSKKAWELAVGTPMVDVQLNQALVIPFVARLMWRNTKDMVRAELSLPDQHQLSHTVELDAIARYHYNRLHEECTQSASAAIKKWCDTQTNRETPLSELDSATAKVLLAPLLRLRQACDHPLAAKSNVLAAVTGEKAPKTMQDVASQMITKVKNVCGEAFRSVVMAWNGLAAMALIPELKAVTKLGLVEAELQYAQLVSMKGIVAGLPADSVPLELSVWRIATSKAEEKFGMDYPSPGALAWVVAFYHEHKGTWASAESLYRQVIRRSDEYAEKAKAVKSKDFMVDKMQLLHAMYNLESLLEAKLAAAADGDVIDEDSASSGGASASCFATDTTAASASKGSAPTMTPIKAQESISGPADPADHRKSIIRQINDLKRRANLVRHNYTGAADLYVLQQEAGMKRAQEGVKFAAHQWVFAAFEYFEKTPATNMAQLLSRLLGEITTNDANQPGYLVESMGNAHTLAGMRVIVHRQLEKIKEVRAEMFAQLKKLQKPPTTQEVHDQASCPQCRFTRTARTQSGNVCIYCVAEDTHIRYETLIFARSTITKGQKSAETAGGPPGVATSDEVKDLQGEYFYLKKTGNKEATSLQGPTAMERVLRQLGSQYKRSVGADHPGVAEMKSFFDHIAALKKEFVGCRDTWRALWEKVSALDELAMCAQRVQIQTQGQVVEEAEKFAYVKMNEYHEKMLYFRSLELEHNQKLERAWGQLTYLSTLADQKKGGGLECSIHLGDLGTHYCVFPCGHTCCVDCVSILSKRSLDKRRIKCHTCRMDVLVHQIEQVVVAAEPVAADSGSGAAGAAAHAVVAVEGDHSPKINAIVRCLKQIRSDDYRVKSIVFSQWASVLELIDAALKDNGVQSLRLAGPAKKDQELLAKFKSDPQIECLLMPTKKGAHGLNLTEATHVLLVEPLLDGGMEAQAVGRVHRMGQEFETHIHRFVTRGTVEEAITKFARQSAVNKHKMTPSSPKKQRTRKAKGGDEIGLLTLGSLEAMFDQPGRTIRRTSSLPGSPTRPVPSFSTPAGLADPDPDPDVNVAGSSAAAAAAESAAFPQEVTHREAATGDLAAGAIEPSFDSQFWCAACRYRNGANGAPTRESIVRQLTVQRSHLVRREGNGAASLLKDGTVYTLFGKAVEIHVAADLLAQAGATAAVGAESDVLRAAMERHASAIEELVAQEDAAAAMPDFERSHGDIDGVEPETPRIKINAVAAQASSGDAGSSGSSAWASNSAGGHDVGGGILKRQKLQSSVADAAGQSLSPLAPSRRLPASGRPMLARFLRVAGIGPGHIKNVLDLADRMGIETPQDFAEMSEQELVVQGFKVLHARKILRALAPI